MNAPRPVVTNFGILSSALAGIGVCFVVLLLLGAPSAIDQFADLFRGFGTDLPVVTRLVTASPFVLRALLCWPPAAAQVVLTILLFADGGRAVRRWFRWLLLGNVALVLFVFYAMYAPIFKMGQAI